jgi:hypothetical protein
VVLAEAYECKILSNPWLASSTAAKQSVIETSEPTGDAVDVASTQRETRPQEPSLASADDVSDAFDNNASFPQEKSTSETNTEGKSVGETRSENQLDAAAVLASLEQSTGGLDLSALPPTADSKTNPAFNVVEAAPPGPPHPLASISTSDATFGEPLRAKFLAAANLVRYNHGVTMIKEVGDDTQLDCIVHEVILAYQVGFACLFRFSVG